MARDLMASAFDPAFQVNFDAFCFSLYATPIHHQTDYFWPWQNKQEICQNLLAQILLYSLGRCLQ